MSQDIEGQDVATHICNVGVEVPILLHDGRSIALSEAQRVSADAANVAAYKNITRAVGLSEATCEAIRRDMRRILQKKIPGSRVTTCRSTIGGVPVPMVPFP